MPISMVWLMPMTVARMNLDSPIIKAVPIPMIQIAMEYGAILIIVPMNMRLGVYAAAATSMMMAWIPTMMTARGWPVRQQTGDARWKAIAAAEQLSPLNRFSIGETTLLASARDAACCAKTSLKGMVMFRHG